MQNDSVVKEMPAAQAEKPAVNAAIFYTVSDFRTTGDKLMGRHAASEGFLRGFVQHSGVEDFYCYAYHRAAFDDFSLRVRALAAPQPVKCRWVAPMDSPALKEPGCLFTSDPNISRYAWARRQINQRAYSLCGVTHTISSQGSIDLLASLVTAPVQPWDAVICTSRAVKHSVEHLLGNWGEYLAGRLGAARAAPALQLPVIPLGIDCSQFDAKGNESELRQKWRARYNIGDDDVVFLFVGRLSFHAKAHPTPMYLALEETAKKTGKRIHLIQSGWFANDSIADAFKHGARVLCPSVNAIFVDGRQPDVRQDIWFAADVFTSLSDNIQETFGLTPIEAMAAGLPVVVTDWDGYRDTVRDGVDGMMVPTLTPPPGYAKDLALRFEMEVDNYDIYIGNTSHCVSVDIAAASKAYTALVEDKELRKRMGAAGKKRALEVYDWKHVIAAYMELWQELGALRQGAEECAKLPPGQPANPLRDDPFSLFSSYPTGTLQADQKVSLARHEPLGSYDAMSQLALHNYGFHATPALCRHLLSVVMREGEVTVARLLQTVTPSQQVFTVRALVELAKMGIISVGGHNGEGRRLF